MKLLLVILEGQLYLAGIVAVFAAELSVLFWGLWSRRPIIGLIAVFVTVPLIRSTVSAMRACFFRVPAPDGLPIERIEGRALYEMVDDLRRTLDAPHIDAIIVSRGCNASVATYIPPWRLRRRRVLVLGFPVLTTLSSGELRAVIAHELAHLSRAYDPFAAWVYRTRRSWLALRVALDKRLATPVYIYWLMHWYVPRLNAASADVSRRHELVADQAAAEIAGGRTTADALVVIECCARFAEETFWPDIQISHQTCAEPPRPFSGMLTWNARTVSSDDLLADLVAAESAPVDTHPSLRERFDNLQQTVQTPPTAPRSAGAELLAGTLEGLAARLDEDWLERHGEDWRRQRAKFLDQRATLDRLAAIAAPTPEELFRRAELIEMLEGGDSALPFFESAAARNHPAAGLAAGRLLLDRTDVRGIALIEAAMHRDESLVPEGCRILAHHYTGTNQDLAARKCEWRATRHATHARLARQAHGQ